MGNPLDDLLAKQRSIASRIDSGLTKITKYREGKTTQDIIATPLSHMDGPYPIRKMREKLKKDDKALNSQGQINVQAHEEQDRLGRDHVEGQLNKFQQLSGSRKLDEMITTLVDVIEFVLCQWETKDLYLTQFFEKIIRMLLTPGYESFLPRLIKVEKPREYKKYKLYENAKFVLYEIWEHASPGLKDELKKAYVRWMDPAQLLQLGYPLHAAAYTNDVGTFVVLEGLGVPLDVPAEDLGVLLGDYCKEGQEGKTALTLAFDYYLFDKELHTLKAFTHYVESQFQAIENTTAIVRRQTRALEVVKKIARGKIASVPLRSSAYQIAQEIISAQGALSPRMRTTSMVANRWFSSNTVKFPEENYGSYQALRTKILTSVSPVLMTLSVRMLVAGEFKAFMYLKWLGYLRADNKIIDMKNTYLRKSSASGNTYLHFLVSHWDDPEHVCSHYERHMRLSAMKHVLSICGDEARLLKNKEGKTPWDMCDSEELKSILRYLNINVSGSLSERIMSAVTWEEPALLRLLPTHLTTDSFQLVERVIALADEYLKRPEEEGGITSLPVKEITPLEFKLAESLRKNVVEYITAFMKCTDEKREAGDLIIMLQQFVTLSSVEEPYTYKDKFLSATGQHLLNKIDTLLDDVADRHSIDMVGRQGYRDVEACRKADNNRKGNAKNDEQKVNLDVGKSGDLTSQAENNTGVFGQKVTKNIEGTVSATSVHFSGLSKNAFGGITGESSAQPQNKNVI